MNAALRSVLPDVAAHFHIQECGAAVAAPRASRAGLPLRGSGPGQTTSGKIRFNFVLRIHKLKVIRDKQATGD